MARSVSLSVCLTVACVCGAAVTPAGAQTGAGEITGLVKDQAGAAVPGATITVTETRTNLQRVVVSTGDGVYTAASLAPGEYRLDVELAGFKPVRREGIRLATGEKARIDFDLAVGGVREQVTVVGRRADRASGDREPRDGRRERAGRAAAAERPPVHHARRHRAGRRPAAEFRPAAHQRRETANQRVSLRRHLRAAARAGAGGVLPDHRRHPGVQDREQQPAGRVRAVQRRRGQSHDEVGHQCLSRQRVRVLSQRAPERQELLPEEQSGETGLSAESVRRHVRRPAGEGPDVLLRRLSGPATEHRPHGDLERAHARRTFRGLPPEHLRSGDDGRETRVSSFRTTRFREAPWIRSRCRCSIATRCRPTPPPRTTTAGRPTKSTIRIRATCASITSSRPAGIRRSDG